MRSRQALSFSKIEPTLKTPLRSGHTPYASALTTPSKHLHSNDAVPTPSRSLLAESVTTLMARCTQAVSICWETSIRVEAKTGVKDVDAKWIGWAGVNVPDVVGQKALRKALAEKRCIPVFLDEEIVHQYYNGYCNNILWPLFHYLRLPQEDRLATTRSFQSQFDAYKRANQMFADVVNQHYEEGDVVWCHDYHLMYLPKCLKEYNSKMKVGWFLHTPFPSSEIHRTLPSRSELLRSVLAADLVGKVGTGSGRIGERGRDPAARGRAERHLGPNITDGGGEAIAVSPDGKNVARWQVNVMGLVRNAVGGCSGGAFTEGRILGIAGVGASVPGGWSRGMKDLALWELRRRSGHGCQIE
ncbi:Alpha,alpha-trehalose-phosphate synthase [UDP-forming] 1 [Platanthera guangdongensis]|uniref:Alpha,alpha-trehalose-phosphate synthase [UDP-forming] 1 n=1 Tax=Platanthera guangdongensis TaxID=2320717 RepID=A0ABR2MWS3_9ASPA